MRLRQWLARQNSKPFGMVISSNPASWRVAAAGRLGVGMLVLGLAGCNGTDPVATFQQITDPAQMFTGMRIDHPAVTLSTAVGYNTLQLTATPLNALGGPMTGLSAPVFHLKQATDSTKVTVTPTGLLTAKGATGDPIVVLAELVTGDNVRQMDSAFVAVTTLAPPPVLTTFSIDAVPPDSALWALPPQNKPFFAIFYYFAGLLPIDQLPGFGGPHPVVQALDADGNPMDGLPVEYTSLDPMITLVDRWDGTGHPLRLGQARIVASTTAYGVTKADTTVVTVTWPFFQVVDVDDPQNSQQLVPGGFHLAHSGLVYWVNDSTNAVDVTFDDPTNVAQPPDALCVGAFQDFFGAPPEVCGTGNFTLAGVPFDFSDFSGIRIRQFPVPGVYSYHTNRGATGQIIVEE